jgi:hypothetical protein
MLLAPGGFLRVARKYFSTTAQQETQTVGESPHIIALRFRDQPPENCRDAKFFRPSKLIPSSGQGPNAVLNFS